jgi:hypothetical protein
MARERIYEYVFSPGTSGLGTIKVPGRYNLADFLAIYNTTDQISIYNFGAQSQGGTVSWSGQGGTVDFPYAYGGVTTLNLEFDTSLMAAGDKLAIYVESQEIITKPWAFGIDAIGRERVSNPQSLIDADFEYGLQNTKWQNAATTNQIPNFYENVGLDINVSTNGYVSMLAGDNLITSNIDTACNLQNPGSPQWVADDFALLVSQTVGNTTALVSSYLTANVNSSAERTFTVASTTGLTAGDNIMLIGRPTSGGTTLAVANITSTATTSVNCANAAGILDGSYIIVQTDTPNVYETMAVTNVSANVLTVTRQTNNTNGAGANITIGNAIYPVSTLEVAQVFEVTDSTTLQLTRGWYNIPAANTFATGTVFQRLSGNVELVNMSAINTAVNGTQTITRGQFLTTALTGAGVGSPLIRMTGLYFASGNANIPQVAVNADAHGLTAGNYCSTLNTTNSNTEGVNFVSYANTNNFAYYPKRSPSLAAGYPLNQTDTSVRQAFAYTGADLDITSIVSDGATPSTITVTTTYAHGLNPGTPIMVNLSSGTNQEYAEGSFFVISVPSTTTFTYTAKSGAAVSGSLAGVINVRSNATFLPRPFDGGVIMSPGSPTRGASSFRQTKKYFRYQSGKGILFSSGTMLQPTFDIAAISASGTNVNSNISITTDLEHGLNPGAVITITGVTTSGYNGSGYVVTSITSDLTFVVQAQFVLGSTTAELGQQPRINVTGWHGSSIRAGIFDDQNGLFWEHDGQSLNVVQRSSTFQLAGLVSVGAGSNLVTGDGTCRFQDQLNQGDIVVIRGMSHTVTSILSQQRMTVVPPFRGVANQTRVKMTLRLEQRIRQEDFNVDPLDGTGASGFTIEPSKMQMLAIEYSWYGAGYVTYMARGQFGEFVPAHRITNNNRNNEAYMRSGNLPARYEASNDTAISSLNGVLGSSDTTIYLRDATDYPEASVTYPVYCMIESEIIKYSGIDYTLNSLTGVTRAATFQQWAEGQSRSYTSSAAVSHPDNTGVILISNTCVPVVNHWGSAVIMDGSFDGDQGYQFTFNRTNYGMPATTGNKSVPFAMRLSPSVSNSIIGNLGQRDLINRAQLTLASLIINLPVANSRFLIEGILNPANLDSANTEWQGLNNLGGGFQPSFTQFAVAPIYTASTTGGLVGSNFGSTGGFTKSGTKRSISSQTSYTGITPTNVSSSGSGAVLTVTLAVTGTTTYTNLNTQITVTTAGTGYAVGDTIKVLGTSMGGTTPTNDLNLTVVAIVSELSGGERLFAIPVSTTNSGLLDLSTVKQIGTSAIPGQGTYPDGPEVLAIQVTALSTVVSPTADLQIQFQESQA